MKWPTDGNEINEKYEDISDIYASSRECKLIKQILESLPDNIPEFKDAVAAYDRIAKLESWNFELVYFIEKYMEDKLHEPPDLDNELGFDNDEQKEQEEKPKVQQNNPFDQQADSNDAPDLDDL